MSTSPTRRGVISGADQRIYNLNGAMCRIETVLVSEEVSPLWYLLRHAIAELQEVKASLIEHLDHDRRQPILFPPSSTSDAPNQPPDSPPIKP